LKERQTRRVPLISHCKIFMLLILKSINLFELLSVRLHDFTHIPEI
jgi:hypothetical protein